MRAESLLALYERVAETPEAVAKLRRFVLDLAVRGNLVEQDPADEPAQELLRRIHEEREHLVAKELNKKPRNALSIERSELPFCPPGHWAWCRLVDVALPFYGFAFESSRFNGERRGMPLIRIRDISKTDTEAYYDGGFDSAYVVRNGDYLVGMDGDFNLRRWSGSDALLNQRVLRINEWRREVDPEFVRLPLQMILTHIHSCTSQTTVKHLSAKQVNGIELPLPPLAEQHRIVAKVDELMTLLDQLEATRNTRETARDRLTTAGLSRLAAANTDAKTLATHVRFALDVLPALTTQADQIKQLRQTILNLAVQGKLVKQDPTDEPAEILLEDIERRRAALLDAGYPNPSEAKAQMKKQTEQTLPEGLQALPLGWMWSTLQKCSLLVIDCKNKTAPYVSSGIRLIRTTNVRDGEMNSYDQRYVTPETYELWSTRGKPVPGDILITREAPMGEVCIIPDGEQVCLGQRMMLARMVPNTIDPRFMLWSLRDPDLMHRVQDKPLGMTVQHLRVGGVETLLVPVPPRAEQDRIVAKVDELMALCDRLEAALNSAGTTRAHLLEALLHEALSPSANNVIDFATARERLLAKREAIACRVIQRLAPTRGFGRVRAMKLLYLAETHCGVALGGQWGRGDFGPFDQWIYRFESDAAGAGWFSISEKRTTKGGTKIEYKPSPELAAKAEVAIEALGDQSAEFERMLTLLASLDTEATEIVATLFAAWNDLLLEGKPVNDEVVIIEVREHWHPSKARFGPAELQSWMAWLRKHGLVPKGRGPSTRHQQALI